MASDGLFHLASTAALLIGGCTMVRPGGPSRRAGLRPTLAGILMGAGGFNLYDGIVQHKVFRLHQVRYGVDPLPYDAVFIAVAAATLLSGLALRRGSARRG